MQLLLDSSGPLLVAALARSGQIMAQQVASSFSPAGRDVAAVVQSLLGRSNSSRLQAIGVGIGPGSFIGTRVAVSFANGLAAASGIAVHPLPSLAAYAAAQTDGQELAVLRDARRGEAYLHFASATPESVELVPLPQLAARLAAAACSRVIAESAAVEDKHAAQWQEQVTAASAGLVLHWAEHVPAAGLLALLGHCPPRELAEPLYLRGFT